MPRRKQRESLEFAESEAPPDSVVATIDGAARGNPGPAAYGVVFADSAGKVLTQLAGRLGRATNNVAEYRALLVALTYARTQGWRAVKIRTDSELLARQLQGHYRVRSSALKPLHEQARQLIGSLDYFAVQAVARKLTRAADKLANAALDRRPVPRDERPARKKLSPAAPLSRAESRDATGTRTVRAVYEAGVLRPLEKLELMDGTEVEVTVRRLHDG
ncbi:MAG: reverse transcriptase-like protein [Acidobacteria bacterium]|nr:reverse transcriptase-like protein [Acidobacteriota bacterium]